VVFLNVLGGILGGDGLIHGGEAVCVLMVWWILGDGVASRCGLWRV
jgi:hypothetical protein